MEKDSATIRQLEKHLEQVKNTLAHPETKEENGSCKIPLSAPWMKSLVEAHYLPKNSSVSPPKSSDHPIRHPTHATTRRNKIAAISGQDVFQDVQITTKPISAGDLSGAQIFPTPCPTPLPKVIILIICTKIKEFSKDQENQLVLDSDIKFKVEELTGPDLVMDLIQKIDKQDKLEKLIQKMNSFKFINPGVDLLAQVKPLFEQGCKQSQIPKKYQLNAWKVLKYTLEAWTQTEEHWATSETVLSEQCSSYIQQFRSCATWMSKGLEASSLAFDIPFRALFTVLSAILIHRNPHFSKTPLLQIAQEIHASMVVEFKIIARKLKIPGEPLLLSILLLARVYGFRVSLAQSASIPFPCQWPFISKISKEFSHEIRAFDIASQISSQVFNQLHQENLLCTLP